MKTRIATAISVAGVLFAGSAAALVNTQVLSGHDTAGSASVLETASTLPASAPTVAITVASSAATTTGTTSVPSTPSSATTAAATTAATAAATTPTAPASAPTAYQVGEAGLVTLDAAGGTLVIVAVTPSPGWTVTMAEPTAPNAVRIVLVSATVEVTFDAVLGAGGITTSVDARAVEPPTAPTSPSVSTSYDDDDDDEDRDDDRRGGRDDDDDDDRGGDDDDRGGDDD